MSVERRAMVVIHETLLRATHHRSGRIADNAGDLLVEALDEAGYDIARRTDPSVDEAGGHMRASPTLQWPEQQPRRQDSLRQQLIDLHVVAARLGMYDAADWLWKNGLDQ